MYFAKSYQILVGETVHGPSKASMLLTILSALNPKGSFGCNLGALNSVQNRVDLELQSNSKATVYIIGICSLYYGDTLIRLGNVDKYVLGKC